MLRNATRPRARNRGEQVLFFRFQIASQVFCGFSQQHAAVPALSRVGEQAIRGLPGRQAGRQSGPYFVGRALRFPHAFVRLSQGTQAAHERFVLLKPSARALYPRAAPRVLTPHQRARQAASRSRSGSDERHLSVPNQYPPFRTNQRRALLSRPPASWQGALPGSLALTA